MKVCVDFAALAVGYLILVLNTWDNFYPIRDKRLSQQ